MSLIDDDSTDDGVVTSDVLIGRVVDVKSSLEYSIIIFAVYNFLSNSQPLVNSF